MKFSFSDEKLTYVEPMFRRIADQYLSMLNTSFLFRAKLDALEVRVDDSMGLDDFQGQFASGLGQKNCSIIIHVTPDLSEAQTAFVIAHEIGHMLVDNMGVGSLFLCGGGEIGTQRGVTRSDGGDQEIGVGLNEGIADFMADEVVSRIWPEWMKELHRQGGDKSMRFLARMAGELSKCFGRPLKRLEQFDQMDEIGRKIIRWNESMKPVRAAAAFVEFKNMFWLCLSRQSFDVISGIYDEIMGEGQFRELCLLMDTVYRLDDGTPEERALVKLLGEEPAECKEITERIRRFRKLKAKKDREYEGVSERKLAADSLKMAFDMMKQQCRSMYIPEGNEAFRETVKAFEKTLNKGRVWKSAAQACSAYERMNGSDKPILAYLPVGIIGEIMSAVSEVAAYYEGEAAQPPENA